VWIITGGDDQVHLWWQVLEQKGEGVVDGLGFDQVVVIEDEDNPIGEGGDLVSGSPGLEVVGRTAKPR
jgi:hypothetical protein